MDPSADPPATPAEPAAHVAHAANPTPSHAANHSHNHPPYAEMITAAIGALKDRKGSSRRAIAKYIDKAYSNLPPTHSALLTHHLKRLKKSGHLVMVKHSYKLPRSVPLSQVAGNDPSAGPKRGPGRPRKPKPETQLNNTGNGPAPFPAPVPASDHESVLISVGLVDVPTTVAKRGPGRPPKLTPVPLGSESGGPTAVKRPRGRPLGSKPKPLSVVSVMGVAGAKRGRGRPPGTGAPHAPRGIGRPKKDATSMAKSPGRPRGRPPKSVGAADVPGVGDGGALVPVGISGGGVLPVKRPGRPPNSGGPKKPRKLSGRPLGRPKKNATTGINLSGQQRQQQLVAYEGLKTKLEQYQLRIKDAVGIVKPHLNAETAATAIRALHELEELATVDVAADAAPLSIGVQEPLLQN